MKKIIASITCVTTILLSAFSMPTPVLADDTAVKKVDMIFTHDIHSFLDSYQDYIGSDRSKTVQRGGFARLKTILDEKREKNPDTLVVDAGDFAMGTLYQTLYASDAVELRMLGRLGFDATTFGNHDFDYGSQAEADMFYAAANSSDPRVPFVINNIEKLRDDFREAMVEQTNQNSLGINSGAIVKKPFRFPQQCLFTYDSKEMSQNI